MEHDDGSKHSDMILMNELPVVIEKAEALARRGLSPDNAFIFAVLSTWKQLVTNPQAILAMLIHSKIGL
jgi:hypothetical protein